MAQQYPLGMMATALSGRGQQFAAPTLAPDLLQRQLGLQQRASLAQGLINQEPLQGQMVSGHYVAPNPLQGLARALQMYAGYRDLAELPKEYSDLQNAQRQQDMAMFGLGDRNQAIAQAMSQGGADGSSVGQSAQATGQPMMQLLPGQSAEQSYRAYSMLGPQEYAKQLLKLGAPTDTQRDLMAAGIQPGSPEYQAILRSNAARPMNVAPGGTLFDPVSQRPIFNAPQDGRQVQFGPQGARVEPVPGWLEAETAQEQARAQGQSAGRVIGESVGKTLTGEKRREAVQAAAGVDASIAQLGRLKETAEALKNHPGFKGISGISFERLSAAVPGTAAADANAQFTTLKSQIAQNVLQMYRQMSQTGGAVGQVSNAEQELFQNNLAALDKAQSPKAMRESLDRIARFVDDSTSRLRSAYDREYGTGTFDSLMGNNEQPGQSSTGDYSNLWGG